MDVQSYINSLEGERKDTFLELRDVILKNIPKGFEECIGYGMIGYVVPHSIYPKGYHCTPNLPLPFASIVMRKDIITLYHMGVYANGHLLEWFKKEYAATVKTKLDMGKSCIRFKKNTEIPFALIATLMQKIDVETWIQQYESAFVK